MCLKFYVIFPNLPTQVYSIYDPSEMILAILYKEVPNMLPAKYQLNQSRGSGEGFDFCTIYKHDGLLKFQIMTILAIFGITTI